MISSEALRAVTREVVHTVDTKTIITSMVDTVVDVCVPKIIITKRAVNKKESQLGYVDEFITYIKITIAIEERIAKKQLTSVVSNSIERKFESCHCCM